MTTSDKPNQPLRRKMSPKDNFLWTSRSRGLQHELPVARYLCPSGSPKCYKNMDINLTTQSHIVNQFKCLSNQIHRHCAPFWHKIIIRQLASKKTYYFSSIASVSVGKRCNVERRFTKVHSNFSRDFPAGCSLRTANVKELKTTLKRRRSLC